MSEKVQTFNGAWIVGSGEIRVLHQQFVIEDGEDLLEVARTLIGVKGKAVLLDCMYLHPSDQWPTAIYRGTVHELAAIRAKANGSQIGRPPSEDEINQDK